MDRNIVDANTNIFHLSGGDCQVAGLKFLGKSTQNQSGMPIYNFIGIIKAPTTLPDMLPTENELTELKNLQYPDIFGPDIFYKARWKSKLDNKVRMFSFQIRGQLTPHTVLAWEIFEGNYYIKMQLHGNFS